MPPPTSSAPRSALSLNSDDLCHDDTRPAGNANAHAQCVQKLTFLRVTYIHTHIPMQNEMQSRISYLTLRRLAINDTVDGPDTP